MASNNSKPYLSYLNKLADQYNNTLHHSIKKNLLMLIILLWLKKLRPILKVLSLKLILSIRVILVKVKLNFGQKKYLSSILCWKLTPGLIKLKN